MNRLCFGLTALLAFTGIFIEILTSSNNVFVYFTTQSNFIVGITTLLLAFQIKLNSKVFKVFRFSGIVGITVTFLIYHTLLAGLDNLSGWGIIADLILHTIVPILTLFGWLIFGPRNLISKKVALFSLVYPILWLVFTLIRGAITSWYPYPFIDVTQIGYVRVIVNVLGITGLFLFLTALEYSLDTILYSST